MIDPVDLMNRFWAEFTNWPSGPLAIRFVAPCAVVAMLAVRDGTRDARLSRTPYLRTVLRSHHPAGLLLENWASVSGAILFVVAIDLLYQSIELNTLHLAEAMMAAILFGAIPYVLIRPPVARVAVWLEQRSNLSDASRSFRRS
jgi:hypothetical protein